MLIDQRKLKLLVLASCHDECVMIYFKTFSFSKLARILQSNWPQKQFPSVSWYDLPTCKVWCWLIKQNWSYRKKSNACRPPTHWHPQSNNQVSPCENLVKNMKTKDISCSINQLFYCSCILVGMVVSKSHTCYLLGGTEEYESQWDRNSVAVAATCMIMHILWSACMGSNWPDTTYRC